MAQTTRLAWVGGAALASVVAIGASALPAGAAKAIKPIATAAPATHIGPFKVTLNGAAGPGAAGGSATYYFTYASGTKHTPQGTVTGAPSKAVSARASGLAPCTKYTYRLVAKDAMGTTQSAPMSFTTANTAPLLAAPGSPYSVAPRQSFPIQLDLAFKLTVYVAIRRGAQHYGTYDKRLGPGVVTFVVPHAPPKAGLYGVYLTFKSKCGAPVKFKQLNVT